jgi:hypothetical protein
MAEDNRHCYLSMSQMITVLNAPKAFDAIMKHLGVPLKSELAKRLTPEEKLDEVYRHMRHLGTSSKNSKWHKCEALEILAATIWQMRGKGLGANLVDRAFHTANSEKELREPVKAWLRSEGKTLPRIGGPLDVFDEVEWAGRIPDLLAYRPKAFMRPRRVIAIELKHTLDEFKRGADQMTTYADCAHEVYLACTPAMAIGYLDLHSRRGSTSGWDASAFTRKLENIGCGLLLVEGGRVTLVQKARENSPPERNVNEVLRVIRPRGDRAG